MTDERRNTPDTPIAITGRTFVPGIVNVVTTRDHNGNLTEIDIQFEVMGSPSEKTIERIGMENIFSRPIRGRLNSDVRAQLEHFE
jgi:hypothetical protein